MTLFEMVTARALASYYETLATNRVPLLGEALFPSDKKMGLKLEWIKGYDNLPVALQPSAFDAKPLLRDRGGVSTESTRMPFFREAMRLGEEDRQNILMFMEANNTAYARQILTRIFDDTSNLIESAMINPEIMRMGLITTGSFVIGSAGESGQNVNYSYNYDPASSWDGRNNTTLLLTDRWSAHSTSNPIKDILDTKRAAALRGISLTRMIIGYTTWTDILQNDKIKLGMNPLAAAAANVIVTDAQVKTYVESITGLRIQVYDKMYTDLDKQEQYFYPTRGCASLLPDATLGKTWYGTTPEEADLMSGNTLADVKIVNSGVAVSTEKIALPVNIINWVSEIVLPSFENMDRVFNIKYTA
jgi:hypothetical protein